MSSLSRIQIVAETTGSVDEESGLFASSAFQKLSAAPTHAHRIEGSRLVYDLWTDTGKGQTPRLSFEEMLDRFLDIENGADVVAFAESWGALGICSHGLPATHAPAAKTNLRGQAELEYACEPRSLLTGEPSRWEPIRKWVEYARMFRAAIGLILALRDGQAGDTEDWQTLRGYSDVSGLDKRAGYSDNKKIIRWLFISNSIQAWLDIGGVRGGIGFELDPTFISRVQLRAGDDRTPGTFGYLAIQAAVFLSGARDIYQCSYCSRLYNRNMKKPNAGENNYCGDCREKGRPKMVASREWRANKKKNRSSKDVN